MKVNWLANSLRAIVQSINYRYAAMSKSVLIVGAYLISGNRTWELKEIPKNLSGITSQFYTYVESIQAIGTGNDPTKSLYCEVLDHLVNMVKDLRFYNIGSTNVLTDANIRRDIQNWIEKPLADYIISYSKTNSDGFLQEIDLVRVKQTYSVVSDLGSCLLYSYGI